MVLLLYGHCIKCKAMLNYVNKGVEMKLTINQYAEQEQVSRPTVYKWIKQGKLITEKTPSGKYRILGVKKIERQ